MRAAVANGPFNPVAEHVSAEDMSLLDASGIVRWDAKSDLSEGCNFPTALSGKRDRKCADLPRRFEGSTYVLTGAGC